MWLLRQQLPSLNILIISQHDSKQLLPRALEVGAHGCIDKGRVQFSRRELGSGTVQKPLDLSIVYVAAMLD